MAFDFEAYQSAGNYVTGAEKLVIAQEGIPFTVRAVKPIFKFDRENYELTVDLPNPETGDEEERTLSFPIGSNVESRDRMLAGMKEHLEGGGEPIRAKLDKKGQAYLLVAA